MDLDFGSIANGTDGLFDEDGLVGVFNSMLGWMKSLTGGLGYFTGGDFEEALAGGFML